MRGKLIVFEGIDGSGKSTQLEKLIIRLKSEQIDFKHVVFPQYSEPSSALLKMYLNGDFGTNPDDVNPYAASTFYAVDRYASFMRGWEKDYERGTLILTDRYTTSNAIHQASKCPEEKRGEFFDWLNGFEYGLLGIPAPDAVVFFSVPVELALEQMLKRREETGQTADIHETDRKYLERCVSCADEASDYYGWIKVECAPYGRMRSIEEIHDETYFRIKKFF